MEAFLDTNYLWEVIEEDYKVPPSSDITTVAQLRNHKEKKWRKSKVKSYLFSVVSPAVCTRIRTLKTVKEIWNFLKKEYEGDEKIKGMQMLNLIRDFEL